MGTETGGQEGYRDKLAQRCGQGQGQGDRDMDRGTSSQSHTPQCTHL